MKYFLFFLISFNSLALSPLPRSSKKELTLPKPTKEKKLEQNKERMKVPTRREFSLPLK